ncbi:MAG: sigma 54-interacting transcriptional regulator, partial [Rikenellaceae bacterium]
GGTIFLDEVAELPLTTQVRLLRVLQTGEFIRVGSSKVQKTNVRVVAATNVNLRSAIEKGHFREDLYYRLNTVPIVLPALRERKEDIHLLFRRFCLDVAAQYSMPNIVLTEEARRLLEAYRWQGNIRQLKNVAEQISVIETKREIDATTLRRYLPEETGKVEVSPLKTGEPMGNSDRELLFTVLYDMRKDILELKKMVAQLSGEAVQPVAESKPYNSPALLNPAPVQLALPRVERHEEFDEDVEVIETNECLTKEEHQKEAIIKALEKHKGRRKDAAKELFISERTLYRRIKELGIDE